MVDHKGKQVNRRGLEIGVLKGTLKGNGVEFNWKETVHGKNPTVVESVGFMVMKEVCLANAPSALILKHLPASPMILPADAVGAG